MQTISTSDLKKLQEQSDDLNVINTLSKENFAKTQIPGSQNVPLEGDGFVKRVEQAVGGKDQRVVVYCASSECDSSTRAARELDHAGFKEVYDYEGGAEAWKTEGGKLVAGAK